MTNQEVIEKYADLVHYLALNRTSQPSDADDVFQEVFLRYIQKSPKFKDDEHGKAWFIRVTINVCNSMFRQTQKQLENEREIETAEDVPSDTDFAAELEERASLTDLLSGLRPRYREVLLLRFDCGYPIRVIAKLTGENEGTVKMMLMRGKKQLKEWMTKGDDMHE